jgi:DNA-binding PadR family transcriptional regulator
MTKLGSVIVLQQHLVQSRAWLSLTGVAPQVFTIFRCKCQFGDPPGKPGKHRKVILNNSRIEFTYLEAKHKYGIKKSRFTRAIDQLVERGFIDVATIGGGTHKVKTLYAISERWRDYGTAAFQDAKRPRLDVRIGFQGRNYKKKSTLENERGSTLENERGEETSTLENGRCEKTTFRRKSKQSKELPCQIT